MLLARQGAAVEAAAGSIPGLADPASVLARVRAGEDGRRVALEDQRRRRS